MWLGKFHIYYFFNYLLIFYYEQTHYYCLIRNGITTEITNTDAEGRLILADALSAAAQDLGSSPSVVVDFATLTGAARVALGNEIPALFSNDTKERAKLWEISGEINDELWPLPLAENYRPSLKSNIADIVNSVEGYEPIYIIE